MRYGLPANCGGAYRPDVTAAMRMVAAPPMRGTKNSADPSSQSVMAEIAHHSQGSTISGQRAGPRAMASSASVASTVGSGASPNTSAAGNDRPSSGARAG